MVTQFGLASEYATSRQQAVNRPRIGIFPAVPFCSDFFKSIFLTVLPEEERGLFRLVESQEKP
jgi:hypothetical protein